MKSPKPADTIFVPVDFWKVCQKKYFLSVNHKCKQQEFDKYYYTFDWNNVLWSDEAKYFFSNKH